VFGRYEKRCLFSAICVISSERSKYALFGAKPLPLNFSQRIMGLNEVGAGVRLLALRNSHPDARRIDNPGPSG
jgi:hypothetical protein